MKSILSLLVITLFTASVVLAQTTDNGVISTIRSGYSERAYSSEPVTDQQINVILQSGIKSPSSRNLQPWKFTVVRDETTMKEIINDILPGNIIIIVSGEEKENGATPDFDCGLATSSMFIAAHGLGLGARIYGSPVARINANKELFNIPAGYKAIVALRIGNRDKSVDAVTTATPRKSTEEIILHKK